MTAQRRLLLTAWSLLLTACPGDDAPALDTDSEGSTGTTGASTTMPVTVTATTEGTEPTTTGETEAVDTTVGETTAGETTAGETTTGDTTTGDTTTGGTTMAAGECGDGVVDADEACDDAGESASCNADCSASMCGDGVVNATALEACDDGNPDDFDFCSNACTAAPAVVLDGMHVLYSDTGVLDGVVLEHWDATTSTWYLTGLELSGTLTVVGASALAMEIDGDVVISGLLDVAGGDGGEPTGASCTGAGAGGAGGPGGFDGGDGAGNFGSGTQDGEPGQGPGLAPAEGGMSSTVNNGSFGAAGGGGGGHVVPGLDGVGTGGGVGGLGGEQHMSLPPLVGGGGGGGGGVEKDGLIGAGLAAVDDEGTGGGGGGGAVAIHSTTAITVTGTIDASGGDGGSDVGCPENPGFGGGGAGGTIMLDAPAVDVALGVLDVSGGLGGQPSFNQDGALYVGGDGADGNVTRTGGGMVVEPGDTDTDTDTGELSACDFSESFDGLPDGSDWPAPWVPLPGVLVADVQGGRGRLLPVTGPAALARMFAPLSPDCVDVEGSFTFELTNGQSSGVGLYLRHNGGLLAQTDPPGLGYVAFVQAFGLTGTGIGVWREVAGVETILAPFTVQVINPGTVYAVRFRVTQEGAAATRLQTRVWPLEQQEPLGWHVNLTDDAPALQGVGGGVVVDVWSQLQVGLAADVFVDDIVVGPAT
jgi:cysteine-rich repeat protein